MVRSRASEVETDSIAPHIRNQLPQPPIGNALPVYKKRSPNADNSLLISGTDEGRSQMDLDGMLQQPLTPEYPISQDRTGALLCCRSNCRIMSAQAAQHH